MRRWLFPLASAISLLLGVASLTPMHYFLRYGNGGVGGGGSRATIYFTSGLGSAGICWTYTDVLDDQGIILPPPVFLAACLILPGRWLILWTRRSCTTGTGRCPACGYNLTGNTSGTCPECGTPVPQPTRPA